MCVLALAPCSREHGGAPYALAARTSACDSPTPGRPDTTLLGFRVNPNRKPQTPGRLIFERLGARSMNMHKHMKVKHLQFNAITEAVFKGIMNY
jgi:hypothetical protein